MSRSGPEAIYRLSPAQEGMLFHSLSVLGSGGGSGTGSGAYLLQVSCELAGALNARALRSAWARLAARHTVLRTSFHWEELEHPLQVVHREVELPWIEEDWRGAGPEEQRARIEAWRARDRREGFDPETPPLMRLALVRLAEDRWWFLWTHHHLILDGWSQPVLMREVFAFYAEEAGGPAAKVGVARPFGEQIGWLRGKDRKDLKERT